MKCTINQIPVTKESPFAKDKLGRKEHVLALITLLENSESPMVLGINSAWGTGKTVFMKMLAAQLKKNKRRAVYFSAWETDFAEDPLIAFLGELEPMLDELAGPDKQLSKKVKQATIAITKRTLPVAIGLLASGVPGAGDWTNSKISELLNRLSEGAFSEKTLPQYIQTKKQIKVFRNSIRDILSKQDDSYPVYVLLDELDRCRPTYAIEFLERIKHLLDIEGLTFIIATDREQLCHSIKAVYGSEFDAARYLKRFINLEYSLPVPDKQSYIDFLAEEILGFEEVYNRRNAHSAFKEYESILPQSIGMFVNSSKYSIRDIEQLMARLNVVLRIISNIHIYPPLLVSLLYARMFHFSVYQRYFTDAVSAKEMVELIETHVPKNSQYWKILAATVALLYRVKQGFSSDKVDPMITRYRQDVGNESLAYVRREYACEVANAYNHAYSLGGDSLKQNSLYECIEIAQEYAIPTSSAE